MNMKKIVAYVHIGDYGQAVDNIKFITDNEIIMSDVSVNIERHFCDLSGKALSKGVLSAEQIEGGVEVAFDPFLYRYDFRITGKIGGEDIEVTKDNIDEVVVKDLDTFTARKENGVIYRIYEPEAASARPLVLFLHGGGECGEDNVLQMTGTLGALRLAEKWPDMYIMAPQAPAGSLTMQENFEVMRKRGNPFRVEMGMTPFALKGERGWNRDYLGNRYHTPDDRGRKSRRKKSLCHWHEHGRRRNDQRGFHCPGFVCGGAADLSEHEWGELSPAAALAQGARMDLNGLYGSSAWPARVHIKCLQ